MRPPPEFGGFEDVDRAAAPDEYADYLAEVRDLDAVREWKLRSVALLEPRPGAVLLDAGCGTGEDVRLLAEAVAPGGRALGIDASTALVAEARRRAHGPACEFRVGDLRRLDLADGSVDGARAERVLQHLARPDEAARELARVVRPGGRVVVAEPDWGTLVVDPGDPAAAGEVGGAAVRRLRSATVGRRLRGLLVDAGLREVGVAARTLVITDRTAAERLLDLAGAAARAVADGRLEPEEAERLQAEQIAADARGAYLAAMTAFMAWGRR